MNGLPVIPTSSSLLFRSSDHKIRSSMLKKNMVTSSVLGSGGKVLNLTR